MQPWNTPHHHIADTDHGLLRFADGTTLQVADWEVTANAPDRDGRIYKSVQGWAANITGTGTPEDPYVQPVDDGRARLSTTTLRGQPPFNDLDVHVEYFGPLKPHPNTWDHPGYLVTVMWMDRRVDDAGNPTDDNEIGSTTWTHPETGRLYDLHATYLPAGQTFDPDGWHWKHYDHWQYGVPLLELFRSNSNTPTALTRKPITDEDFEPVGQAPPAESDDI